MFDLIHICSQYELLERLAQNLSTMDLYHTALTCSKLYDLILRSPKGFERLKRVALCDGSGLVARQAFEGVRWHFDPQEIEIRVWNTRCDETGGLPCLKCGVNVCEECRVYPRVGDRTYGPCRRPHFTTTYQLENIICYCDACDKAVETRVGKDLCTCDRYTRWICRPCRIREDRESYWICKHCTTFEGGWDEGECKTLADHQHHTMYRCPCLVNAPPMGNIRCLWCKKKHKTIVLPRDDYSLERRALDYDDQEGFSHPFEADPRVGTRYF